MVSLARDTPPAAADDAAIRDPMLAEMKREQWAPAAMTDVVVHDGVVELWGAILDERQRAALKVVAENIPGVKAVKDHMVWVEPISGMAIEPRTGCRRASRSQTDGAICSVQDKRLEVVISLRALIPVGIERSFAATIHSRRCVAKWTVCLRTTP